MVITCSVFGFCIPGFAQVPHAFTDGTPALAAQVNANFNTLVTQIHALQAQVTALQSQPGSGSVVGTWDLYTVNSASISTEGGGGRSVSGGGSKGTLTLVSNGTFTVTNSEQESTLSISLNVPQDTNTIHADIFNNSSEDSDNGTYSVSGNTISFASEHGPTTAVFSADAGVLMIYESGDGEIALTMGIKR